MRSSWLVRLASKTMEVEIENQTLQFSNKDVQAWYLTEATEAIASVAPGLCLGALSKVPIEIYKFLIEVPFAKKKNRLAPSSTKYQAWMCMIISN